MIRKVLLPILAALGVLFAFYTVVSGSRPSPVAAPAAEPSHAPFSDYVAGAGIVEALSENIQVGTIVPGVVKEIYVKVGDNVKKGQPLWLIDDRDLQSDLLTRRAAVAVQQAMLESAQSKFERLKQMPRPEEIPPMQAAVDADRHSLEDAQDQLRTLQAVSDPRAFSKDDWDRRTHAVEIAKAAPCAIRSQPRPAQSRFVGSGFEGRRSGHRKRQGKFAVRPGAGAERFDFDRSPHRDGPRRWADFASQDAPGRIRPGR